MPPVTEDAAAPAPPPAAPPAARPGPGAPAPRGAAGLVEGAVAAVPGLAALVYGVTLPAELRPLFTAGLAVVLFATLATVLLAKGPIRRWSARRTRRFVVAAAAGALAALALFLGAQGALLRSYRYPAGAEPVTVLVPRRLAAAPWRATAPYLDCRDALGETCDAPVRRAAASGDELAELLAAHGPWNVRVERGGLWFAWAALLLALYAAAVVPLVALFGVLAMRRITPARLAAEFGLG